MGRVYLSQSPSGRLIAVKVVHSHLAEDAEFRARFKREVTAARKVSGIFTAPVVSAELDGDVPWVATAYVPGPSLADAVEQHGPLPLESVESLAAGLAEGLCSIHEAGVIHRDLKPSNIILAPDGPRIIDFGISSAVGATTLTGTGSAIGSPGFMSPEQAEGETVGPASDIFSLGAVLTFAAKGESPFGFGSPATLLLRLVHGNPNIDGTPDTLRPLLLRCMDKDPGRRPAASEILAEISSAHPPRPDMADRLPPQIFNSLDSDHSPDREASSTHTVTTFSRASAASEPQSTVSKGTTAPLAASGVRRRIYWYASGAALLVAAGVVALITVPGHGTHLQQKTTASPQSTISSASVPSRAPQSASSPPPRPSVQMLSVTQLRVGNCVTGSDLSLNTSKPWPTLTQVVPCNESHIGEVFFADMSYWPAAKSFPGYTTIANAYSAECSKQFNSYIGVPVSESEYNYADTGVLDSSAWAAGGRELICVVFDPTDADPGGAPLTGSIKGARR
jgi:eukaryotic-like serine/threonine-protein kinase